MSSLLREGRRSDRCSHHAFLRMIDAQLPLQDYLRRDSKGQLVSSLLNLG